MMNKLKEDLTDIIINHINDSENNKKIKSNIIDPIIIYIFDKFYPYLVITLSVILIMFILILCIFVLIIRSLK